MKKYRLMFDFTSPAKKRLDELVKITEAPCRAEVVRQALAHYDRTIHFVNDDKVHHIQKDGQGSFKID